MAKFSHSAGYLEDEKSRHLSRLLHAGTFAMQQAALAGDTDVGLYPRAGEMRNAYMPGETPTGGKVSLFEARVRQTVLAPVWEDSVRKSAMAPLRETIRLDGYEDRIIEWERSLDGNGRSTVPFLTPILQNQAIDGIAFVQVDLPVVLGSDGLPVQRSSGDDDAEGIRPYCVPVAAGDFDPLSVISVAGRVVLLGCAVYQESSFRDENGKETQLATWREYRLTEAGVEFRDHELKEAKRDAEVDRITGWSPVQPLGSETNLQRIPFEPFTADFSAMTFRGKPPYARPAELAAAAYRKRGDKDDLGREIARLRFHQTHVEADKDGNPKLKMGANFYFNENEGSMTVLESSGSAMAELRADLTEDENAIRAANRSIAAERVSGEMTAMEVGLRALEGGTFQEVQTEVNRVAYMSLLRTLEIMGGIEPSGGTVAWDYESVRMLSSATLNRAAHLVETPGDDGEPLLPVSTLLHMEKAAGNLPENFDIEKAIAGTLGT